MTTELDFLRSLEQDTQRLNNALGKQPMDVVAAMIAVRSAINQRIVGLLEASVEPAAKEDDDNE